MNQQDSKNVLGYFTLANYHESVKTKKMIKKIAFTFALTLTVVGLTYAQDKVTVQKGDVVLMVKITNDDESNIDALNNVKGSQLVNIQSNSVFYLTTSKDASESAIKEINGVFSSVEMKVIKLTAEEYQKQTKKEK